LGGAGFPPPRVGQSPAPTINSFFVSFVVNFFLVVAQIMPRQQHAREDLAAAAEMVEIAERRRSSGKTPPWTMPKMP
jgi:hypothetical protein